MPIINDRQYRQMLTAAVAQRSKTVQDIVTNSTPLTAILKDRGRIKTKRAGGPELRVPIMFDKLQAQWFTGYDKIEITPKEQLSAQEASYLLTAGLTGALAKGDQKQAHALLESFSKRQNSIPEPPLYLQLLRRQIE